MDRFEVEARLNVAIVDAKAAYDSAEGEYLRALEQHEDLGVVHRDGALAFRQAQRNRDSALGKYNQALLRFNRFVLDGKLPEGPK